LIGAAARRTDRGEAVNFALEDAARKAAMFGLVTGDISRQEVRQSSFLGYHSEVSGGIAIAQDWSALAGSFEWDPETDVLEHDNSVFVRVRHPGIAGHSIAFAPPPSSGQPSWTTSPPVFPGYYTGVGHSPPYAGLHDAVRNSCDNAVFSIAETISWGATVSEESVSGAGFTSTGVFDSRSRADLQGFYILDIWIDPATREVWTLGVAKKP
jgi:hypothetical protein